VDAISAIPFPTFEVPFASVATRRELFALLGSTGFLEISANKAAASRVAVADKGSEVTVTIG